MKMKKIKKDIISWRWASEIIKLKGNVEKNLKNTLNQERTINKLIKL